MHHITKINISRVMMLFCFPIWLWQEALYVDRRDAKRRVSLLRSLIILIVLIIILSTFVCPSINHVWAWIRTNFLFKSILVSPFQLNCFMEICTWAIMNIFFFGFHNDVQLNYIETQVLMYFRQQATRSSGSTSISLADQLSTPAPGRSTRSTQAWRWLRHLISCVESLCVNNRVTMSLCVNNRVTIAWFWVEFH